MTLRSAELEFEFPIVVGHGRGELDRDAGEIAAAEDVEERLLVELIAGDFDDIAARAPVTRVAVVVPRARVAAEARIEAADGDEIVVTRELGVVRLLLRERKGVQLPIRIGEQLAGFRSGEPAVNAFDGRVAAA